MNHWLHHPFHIHSSNGALSFQLLLCSQTRFRKSLVPEVKCGCPIHDERPPFFTNSKNKNLRKRLCYNSRDRQKLSRRQNNRFSPLSDRTEARTDDMGCQKFLFKDKTTFKPASHFHSQEAILSPALKYVNVVSRQSATEKLQAYLQTDSCNFFSINTNMQPQML